MVKVKGKKAWVESCVWITFALAVCIFVMIWWLFAKKKVALNKPHQYNWPHIPTESRKKTWITQIPNRSGESYIAKREKKCQGMIHPTTNLNTEWIINTDNENGFVCGFSQRMSTVLATFFSSLFGLFNSNRLFAKCDQMNCTLTQSVDFSSVAAEIFTLSLVTHIVLFKFNIAFLLKPFFSRFKL